MTDMIAFPPKQAPANETEMNEMSEKKESRHGKEVSIPVMDHDPEMVRQMSQIFHLSEAEKKKLTFLNINYKVPLKDGSVKHILKNISGELLPGEIVGVMGPSGSGKTTFLDFLANRLNTGIREGSILVNDEPRNTKTFHHIASYVPQEDHLYGTLTVRETLQFSAEISLPEGTSAEEKKRRIDNVLKDLGLTKCADTPVGNVFRKGISGGQKRRLSMGQELLGLPSILFLDECTSGLDSTSSLRIMQVLRNLAATNRVVMCTLHQPSSDIFHMLDKVMLLSSGRVVYFGPTEGMVDYFAKLGHPCPQYTNPADFAMDLINTDFEGEHNKATDDEVTRLADEYDKHSAAKQLEKAAGNQSQQNLAADDDDDDFSVGYWKQFVELTKRTWTDNVRNPGIFWVRLGMYIILSLMIGTIFLDLGRGQSEIVARVSILFFICAFLVFMSIAVIPFFIQERGVFVRERANGWYSVAMYVLANSVCSLPGVFTIALVSSGIAYPMIGLTQEGSRFGLFLLDLFLSLYVAESLMLLISAIVPVYIIGMALGAGFYGMFMLTQGFFILPSDLPKYWIWGYYMGFHTYSFEMFMYNEFHDTPTKCDQAVCQFQSGDDVLSFYSMDNVSIGTDIGVLVAMAVIYRILFYLVLYKFHKGKR